VKRRGIFIAVLLFISACAFCADFNRNLALMQPRLNGADVLAVQQRLLALGFPGIGIADGWYGPKTEAVVKAFQLYMGFNQDGVVDQMLWQSLFTVGGIMGQFSADLKSANSLSFDRLTKTEKDIPGRSAEGGSMTAYKDRQQDKYVEIDLFGETGKVHYEVYLFEDRRIILKKSYRYPAPYDLEHAMIEDAAYYSIGKTLYQIQKGVPTEVGADAVDGMALLVTESNG
jgi:peptidoglycan hydrolase-like protein with peptidoglycan-binding domain